jgi:pSer/pThr/pTyr-binding forkhead associated (FHA) protein
VHYIIGTAADCDVLVRSEYASPHHAKVSQDRNGRWWVEDLGSTNGTKLRRGDDVVRVWPRHLLQPGDLIIVGRVSIPWEADKPIRVTAEVGQRLDEEM